MTKGPNRRTRKPNVFISFRAGNAPGRSFRVKLPPGAETEPAGGRAVAGTLQRWKRLAVLSGGDGDYRFFELVPSSEENEIEFGGFFVRGRFAVQRRENNARKANEAWKAFEAS